MDWCISLVPAPVQPVTPFRLLLDPRFISLSVDGLLRDRMLYRIYISPNAGLELNCFSFKFQFLTSVQHFLETNLLVFPEMFHSDHGSLNLHLKPCGPSPIPDSLRLSYFFEENKSQHKEMWSTSSNQSINLSIHPSIYTLGFWVFKTAFLSWPWLAEN